MAERFRLTEEDRRLLELVMKVGVGKTEHARRIYGAETNRWQKRLVKLSSKGYITRGGGYIQITAKGARSIGGREYINGEENGSAKKLKLRRQERSYRALVGDIVLEMPAGSGWEFEYSIDLKRRYVIEKNSRMVGVLGYGSRRHAVYYLPQKRPEDRTLVGYVNEMVELPFRGIDGVLVVYRHDEARALLEQRLAEARHMPGRMLKDVVVLQAGDAVVRFRTYMEWLAGGGMGRILPGAEVMPSGSGADYRWDGCEVYDLLLHRPLKARQLDAYYSSPVWRYGYPVLVLCTEGEWGSISERYPHAGLLVLSSDLSGVKHTKAPQVVAGASSSS